MAQRQFEGQVALVTGAATGIGFSAAELFAARGAKVAMVARSEERGREAVERIKSAGGDVELVVADVSVPEQVERMVARTIERFGGLDIAFNNAGAPGPAVAVEEQTPEAWNKVVANNLTSIFLCMRHELQHMKKQGRGAIVNNASGAAVMPQPMLAAYSASKHGVLGLTKSAAREFAETAIRINAVCPGMIETPQVTEYFAGKDDEWKAAVETLPAKRMGRPENIAHAVLWLCSSEAAYVSGESMFIDGALACH